MKIFSPLHATRFDALQYYDKREAETSGEEMLCTILHLENSDDPIFAYLKKRVEND